MRETVTVQPRLCGLCVTDAYNSPLFLQHLAFAAGRTGPMLTVMDRNPPLATADRPTERSRMRVRLARVWANRAVMAEAAVAVTAASVIIRALPFRRLAGWMGSPAQTACGDSVAEVERVRWAVNAFANRAPWRAVCFQRGLAAHYMLRRRGVRSTLHYGVRSTADARLKAHVWVTAGNEPVVGVEEAGEFQRLASFPPES